MGSRHIRAQRASSLEFVIKYRRSLVTTQRSSQQNNILQLRKSISIVIKFFCDRDDLSFTFRDGPAPTLSFSPQPRYRL
jgi:hypothetical protein